MLFVHWQVQDHVIDCNNVAFACLNHIKSTHLFASETTLNVMN